MSVHIANNFFGSPLSSPNSQRSVNNFVPSHFNVHSHFEASVTVIDAHHRQENPSPPLPVNCEQSPKSFSLLWQNSNSNNSTSTHTPTAAGSAIAKSKSPNLFGANTTNSKPQFSVVSADSNVDGLSSTSRSHNVFNNTDPHSVHTEQSNAMPNHGRNVHEQHVAHIARYIPYPSTVASIAKSPKNISAAQQQHSDEEMQNVPNHFRLHRSVSSIPIHGDEICVRDLNSCAFSVASESTFDLEDHAHSHSHNMNSIIPAHRGQGHFQQHRAENHHEPQIHFRHDPYATRHILRASCLPFERLEHAKSDIQAVISAVCGDSVNAVVESVRKADKGHCLEATVCTSQVKALSDKLSEAVVLMDRRGFYVAYNDRSPQHHSTEQDLLDYCEHVRNLPQQERHWRLDGLPCSSAGFRIDGVEARHGNNRGDKNYRQAHLARTQHRPSNAPRNHKSTTYNGKRC